MSEGNHSRSRLLPSLLGLLILLSGLALLAGGIKLASLGGSLYYLLAGIGLALSGLLLLLGKRAALGLYALVLFASTVWALWEVGLDWWQLVPAPCGSSSACCSGYPGSAARCWPTVRRRWAPRRWAWRWSWPAPPRWAASSPIRGRSSVASTATAA